MKKEAVCLIKRKIICLFSLALALFLFSGKATAENYNQNYNYNSGIPQSPGNGAHKFSQTDLKNLVAPIALYPDPLLAQILPASTYPAEIADAAQIIHSEKDFSKIDAQNWDPSVKAVAHYPSVLKMMNDKMDWTQALGQAVLNQQEDVLKAVQDRRLQAEKIGNLKSTAQQKVRRSGNYVEIVPADPTLLYVPVYDPAVIYAVPTVEVFAPPISFGFGFSIGAGWFTGFYWPAYSIVYADPFYWGPYYWGPRYWWSWGWNPFFTVTRFNIVNINRSYVTLNQSNFNRFKWTHNDHPRNVMSERMGPHGFSKENLPFSTAERQKNNLQNFQNRMDTLKHREMNPAQIPNKAIQNHNRPDLKTQGPNRGALPMNANHPSLSGNKAGEGHAVMERPGGFQGQKTGGSRQHSSPGGGRHGDFHGEGHR